MEPPELRHPCLSHSNCFTCCYLNEDGTKIKYEYKIVELERFCKELSLEDYAMVEASTNTFAFVEQIRQYCREVFVANTHKMKLISMVNKKTDKVDAEKLAIYLKMQVTSGEQLISPVYVPKKTIQQLRSLFTTFKNLRKQVGISKNRIHAMLKQCLRPFTKEYIFGVANRKKIREIDVDGNTLFQINTLMDHIEFTEKSISALEEQIKIVGSEYYREIDILTSMKGISVITAIAILADVATVDRFPNQRQFCSYLRSAPGVDSSNDTIRMKGTNKFSRKLAISLVSQSLNHFRDSNEKLNRWYLKKTEKEGHKVGKIRMAVCRKVFVEIYQMLKKGEYHYWTDEKNHRAKMDAYNRFLLKQGIEMKLA